MRWWLLEIPVGKRSLRSDSTFGIKFSGKGNILHPTDPPR